VDLAGEDVEVDGIDREHAGEALGDAAQADDRIGVGHASPWHNETSEVLLWASPTGPSSRSRG
jgi:hypothetical protein